MSDGGDSGGLAGKGGAMRSSSGRRAFWMAAGLLLLTRCKCAQLDESLIYTDDPGSVEIVVQLDPQRAPVSCAFLVYALTGSRTGDAPGGLTASASRGQTAAAASPAERCAGQARFTLTVPDLMQGIWTFSMTVNADAAALFSSACPGVPIHPGTRTVITFTQPPPGVTASRCSFSM